ncbi:MAG TPA: alkaline phosphatase family protein [Gemmatimonadaceae bacterium]|nr:alkaline phosphatase family protein [Gemmatimonadaceae bacterium]
MKLAAFLLASALAFGCSAPAPRTASGLPVARRPALTVVIVVDQLRADYLERFGAQLTGGLGRLAREGTVYANAHQDHAIPETAPGHASVLSGRFPRSTGIFSNAINAEDPGAPLVAGTGYGSSPRRFRGSTLADWILARDPRSRILSVSRKDVGAIFTVGRARAEVYWYVEPGWFTTSTYYRDSLPDWVRRFNGRRMPYQYAGKAWTPLLPDTAYAEPDSVEIESAGYFFTFPHVIPRDTLEAARLLIGWPWMDDVTVAFALDGVDALALGSGATTDLLVVALSTTDAIGHRFGPDSKEIHDQVLRLDRLLGRFMDSLEILRPGGIAIALTSDHGVASFPELSAQGFAPGARRVDLEHLVGAARSQMREHGVDTLSVELDRGIFFMDRRAFAGRSLDPDDVLRRFAAGAREMPGVLRVDALDDLERLERRGDPIARRWRNLIPPYAPAELVITLEPHNVWLTLPNARHDSPHDYDTHVPLILYGPWFAPGRRDEFVRVVDLAPTLARLLGVRASEPIDGRVLPRALH